MSFSERRLHKKQSKSCRYRYINICTMYNSRFCCFSCKRTHQFLEIDINSSVLISLIWSLLIFIIDSTLLTIGGKNILIFIRFLLVVLHCLLGSIIIDLKVFESDINNYMTRYQREYSE